ncbi:hypothetical protein L226DRAFT_574231 [Lentinus tigrinus ALCF2SS1-7]|uniref:Clp1-like protein n=1 Tax=Lentinus tigrinus ALCF2SS1-6 TaxID=1328759 RepID=A0A5C2RYR3_9APHY|nr:hypothetical protein L227DRAFT_614618 [Lentinus tigrinus ALCF2SS1-6]RPD70994.1 hypothetical protein L226DRAFT_574231 [Lentinus tigrinus ALCF2SS1-7]
MVFVPPIKPLIEPRHWRSLPRTLERPPLGKINTANIASADPAYAGITPEKIREDFVANGAKILGPSKRDPQASLTVNADSEILPDHCDLTITESGVAMRPTHVFALYPTFDSAIQDARCSPHQLRLTYPQTRRVVLRPSHSALWAAYCSKLPTITYEPVKVLTSSTSGEDPEGPCSRLRLPLVPLALPYTVGFDNLLLYMYSGCQKRFVSSMLLPIDTKVEIKPQLEAWEKFAGFLTLVPRTKKNEAYWELHPEAADRLGALMAERYAFEDLCRLARNVWGTHQDAVCLGIVDVRLWEALEFAWTALLKAMEIADRVSGAVDGAK